MYKQGVTPCIRKNTVSKKQHPETPITELQISVGDDYSCLILQALSPILGSRHILSKGRLPTMLGELSVWSVSLVEQWVLERHRPDRLPTAEYSGYCVPRVPV